MRITNYKPIYNKQNNKNIYTLKYRYVTITDCEKVFGSKRTAVRFYSVPLPICLAGSSCWPKQGVAWIAHVSDVGTYTGELVPVLCIQYWRWFSTAN